MFSMQTYWSCVFLLPKKIIKSIEQLLSAFLWTGSEKNTGVKVKWDDVCMSKKKCGLGLVRLKNWNKALLIKHIWNIFPKKKKDSLWIEQVHVIKLKSFWSVPTRNESSWFWRKLLQLRSVARNQIIALVGNGQSIYLWQDNLASKQSFDDYNGKEIVTHFNSFADAKLCTIMNDGEWKWPQGRRSTRMVEDMIRNVPSECRPMPNEHDSFRQIADKSGAYTLKSAMKLFSTRSEEVAWYHVVWFKQHIPRYAFILLLA